MNEIIFKSVPKGSTGHAVIESHSYFPSPRLEHSVGGVDLPPGQYEFVCLLSECTEDVAKRLMVQLPVLDKMFYENHMRPWYSYEQKLSPEVAVLRRVSI